MNKLTKVLKSVVCIVWLAVLVTGVTFLSENFLEEPFLLSANQKKSGKEQRVENLQTFLNETKKEARNEQNESLDDAGEKQNQESQENVIEERHAYLTFDDGPSDNTDKILDILKEKGAKATFFVVGKTDEKSQARYKRILKEGHSLGMHSYTHDYDYIYGSLDNYKEDLMKLQDYLYEVTGEKIRIYRFPGGSSNSVSKIPIQSCINFLDKKGIVYYDWNASSEDAVSIGAACSKLNQNILKDALLYHNTVILMHDLHECSATVEGLGTLIDRLQKEGYSLDSITQDTIPVQHVKDRNKEKTSLDKRTQEGKSLPVFFVVT